MNSSTKNKKFIEAACCFAVLLAAEVIIGRFGRGFIRAYLGDVLVIPLIYCLIRIFYSRPNKFLPALTGGLGILAEIIQYFNPCEIFGIDRESLLGIMLGSVADIRDVLCYVTGVILIYFAELGLDKIHFKSKTE